MDKKKLDIILKCIAAVLAVGVFVILVSFAATYQRGTDITYQVVCLGDSNFGNFRDETSITALLEEKLEKKVLNGAFGGSMMVTMPSKKTEYHSVLSMHNMAIAICNHNFGIQKASIETIRRTDFVGYFDESLEQLSQVDFDAVELLIIEHGVNDYLSGVPVKNGIDPYDTDTFSGTLRTVIDMLREKYPSMKIVLVAPAYCAPLGADGVYRPCDEYNYGGGYLEDYVNEELIVAKEMGVDIIDLYHQMGINSENYTTYLYDGLHFYEEGRRLAADTIADYLLGETK